MPSAFVDASAWVAFFNRRDAHQAEARETMERLLRTGAPLATSTWTTYEAITIVRSKLGYGRARRLWQMANNRRRAQLLARCVLRRHVGPDRENREQRPRVQSKPS